MRNKSRSDKSSSKDASGVVEAVRSEAMVSDQFLFFLVSSSSFSSSSSPSSLSRVSAATSCILRIWRWSISWHTFPRRAFVEFHRSEWSLASGSRASPIWSKVENRRCWRYSACRFSSSVPLRILALVRSPRRGVLRINKEKGRRGIFIKREEEKGVNKKTDYEMSAWNLWYFQLSRWYQLSGYWSLLWWKALETVTLGFPLSEHRLVERFMQNFGDKEKESF